MRKARPSEGAGLVLLEERVALGEVERPGLELRVVLEGRCLEELLDGERDEVGRLDEDVAPDLVGVAAELPEGRRGDGRELAVRLGVDVDDEGAVHVGDARLDDARGEELLPEQLIDAARRGSPRSWGRRVMSMGELPA